MATDDRPEWADREIKEAIRILKEDGLHVHKTYTQFLASQENDKPDPEHKDDDTEGKPPPAKTDPSLSPKKKGIWWADRSE